MMGIFFHNSFNLSYFNSERIFVGLTVITTLVFLPFCQPHVSEVDLEIIKGGHNKSGHLHQAGKSRRTYSVQELSNLATVCLLLIKF